MDENFLTSKIAGKIGETCIACTPNRWTQADYFSNDYLGIVKNGLIEALLSGNDYAHGSTGSRLLAGNYDLIEETEKEIAAFHDAGARLFSIQDMMPILGFWPASPKKEILILYDKLSHASIRDGIRQSFAESFSFAHNDLADLEQKLKNTNRQLFCGYRICFFDGWRQGTA